MRLLVTAATAAVFLQAALAQQSIESERHGFSITIPEAWNPADDAFLRNFSRAVSARGQIIRYVGGYQESDYSNGFSYPYVLVQTIPYNMFGLNQQPDAETRREIFGEMTGMAVRDALDQSTSREARALISGDPAIENVTFDDVTGEYNYDVRLEVAGVGTVRGRLRGLWGDWSVLQAAYYASDESWSEHEAQANEILASFDVLHGTPQPKYAKDNRVNRVLGGAFRGAVGGAILGAIVFGVIGLIVGLVRKATS